MTDAIKPTKRRKNILSMLATGWLPWGIDWRHDSTGAPRLPLCEGELIMCCGHTMKPREVKLFADAGLLEPGEPDRFDRPTMVITEAGRRWLADNW